MGGRRSKTITTTMHQKKQKRCKYCVLKQLLLCYNSVGLMLVISNCSFSLSSAFIIQRPRMERTVLQGHEVGSTTHHPQLRETNILELVKQEDKKEKEERVSAFQPWKKIPFLWQRCHKNRKGQQVITSREVTTIEELNDAFREASRCGDAALKSTVVKGNTQKIGSPDEMDFIHPVLKLLHQRRRSRINNSSKQQHTDNEEEEEKDGFKVALAIEGGGMRGCVSAGMVAAIYYLGLEDTFDVVYGSSAGSLIGAYFITRQLPWFGPEVYYDILTTAGRRFIDTRRILRALGLGLLDPRLWRDVMTRRNHGKPVLQLSYLLEETVQSYKPLNWTKFALMQHRQPLKIVASGLKSEKAVVFDMLETKSFTTLEELTFCMHASMLLPGIAGPMMNIGRQNERLQQILRNNHRDDFEPLVDALVYEPLPYRSALADGATHVVVLRTKPDGADVLGKPSFFDRMIMRRFFLRKNTLPNIYRRMRRQEHKRLYAQDVIVLNDAVNHDTRQYNDTSLPHLLPIALPPGSPEISRLETGRKEILEGVRRGFGRAYDALVEDPKERGKGMSIAKQCFPDTILDYDPWKILSTTNSKEFSSAFEIYMRSCPQQPNNDVEEILLKAQRASYI